MLSDRRAPVPPEAELSQSPSVSPREGTVAAAGGSHRAARALNFLAAYLENGGRDIGTILAKVDEALEALR